jgi:hypothetical protein
VRLIRAAKLSTGFEQVDWHPDAQSLIAAIEQLPETDIHHIARTRLGATLYAASGAELHVLDYNGRSSSEQPSWTIATYDLEHARISLKSEQDKTDYGTVVTTTWTFAFPNGHATIIGQDRLNLHEGRLDEDEVFARAIAARTGKRRPLD